MSSLAKALRVGFLPVSAVLLVLLSLVPGAILAADTQAPAVMDGKAESPTPPDGLSAHEWRTMQELVAEAEYQFAWQVSDGIPAYRAPNRAHDLSLALNDEGLYASRYSVDGERLWDWGLSLVAYGGQKFTAIDRANLRGLRERVEVHWDQDVVEWYVNSTEGIEHGLTLAAPPAGMDGTTVELTFDLRGSLAPELDGSGQVLRLKDGGKTVLIYDQLAVYDVTGRALPAHMSLTRGTQSARLQWVVDAAGATYPLTVDPLLHSQAAKLTASDAENGDEFGKSVSVSGDTIVIGAPSENGTGDNRGAAYVFERNQGGADDWGQVTKLTASDAADDDSFGWAVAISGDTIVVGALTAEDGSDTNRGAAYVFERNTGGADNWGQVQKLTASGAADEDFFGNAVAISGDTIVVGAYWAEGAYNNCGAAYVFERNTGGADNWGQVQELLASDAGENDHFGESVAISGDTIVVGADWASVSAYATGSAYVFVRNQGGADNWGQVAQLAASDPESIDNFGEAVAVSGDTVVVASRRKDEDRGAAYVYERNQGGVNHWGQVQKLTASDAAVDDFFGQSIAISSDTVVVGTHIRQAAYVFERNKGGADNWGETKRLTASDAESSDYFGTSVAISGNAGAIIVGANREDGAGSDRGAAYLFVVAGGQWLEAAIPYASDPEDNDEFGISVAISGDTAIIGAHKEDGSGTDRGAAYIIERNWDGTDSWGQVTKVVCFDCTSDDYFGRSVSISGDTAVVGAWYGSGTSGGIERGAAYVYERNWDMYTPNTPEADNWGEVTKLTASDAADNDHFGFSVSISGDTIIVGAWHEDGAGSDRGAAYIFARNEGGADNWGQVRKLTASDAEDDDSFGTSVAISGDTAIVGAYLADGEYLLSFDRGAAYVYERNKDGVDNWGEVQRLTAAPYAENWAYFGQSVSISGDTAVVGAYSENGTGSNRGATYVFERNEGGIDNWGQVIQLTASDAADEDWFGYSVSISGDTAVVGAYSEDGTGSNRGAAYVFERNQGGIDNWGQMQKRTASDTEDEDWFGCSVSISGDTIIAGAYGKDGTGGSDRGAAYIFSLDEVKIYLPAVLRNY